MSEEQAVAVEPTEVKAASVAEAAPVMETTPQAETTSAPKTALSFDTLKVSQELQGTIKRIEIYGAFVDIGIGMDGLLHISQLGKPNVRNVEDVVKPGEQVKVYVLKVDKDKRRVALSLVKPPAVSMEALAVGDIVQGKVIRLEPFGAFVDIGAERPGMIHVSELANGYVNQPSDVVKEGQEIEAKIIQIDAKKKRIDLSIKALEAPVEAPTPSRSASSSPSRETREELEDEAEVMTAMELAFRQAQGGEEGYRSSGRENRKRDRDNRKRDRQREYEEIFERTLRGNR